MALTQERRNYKRLPKESRVVYKIVEYSSQEKELKEARYKDVGGGGLLLETAEPYSLGTLFKVTFDLQGWQKYYPGFLKFDQTSRSEPITVIGQVARVEELGEGNYEIGLKFLNIDERDREGIVRFIEENFGE